MSERFEFERILKRIPYAQYLGIACHEISESHVCFSLPFRDDLVGNARLPALHGGVVAGFAENAALLHLLLFEEQKRVPKPIDFSVDFLRSARNMTTYAECDVLRQGRRVAAVQVRCWQRDHATPITAARGHFQLEETKTGHR